MKGYWIAVYKDLTNMENIKKYVRNIEARPAFQKAITLGE